MCNPSECHLVTLDLKKNEKRSFLSHLPLALSFFHVRARGQTEPREEKWIEQPLLFRAGAPPRQRREPRATPVCPHGSTACRLRRRVVFPPARHGGCSRDLGSGRTRPLDGRPRGRRRRSAPSPAAGKTYCTGQGQRPRPRPPEPGPDTLPRTAEPELVPLAVAGATRAVSVSRHVARRREGRRR